MIVDCIADLHGYQPELEGGDLLLVCGDLTAWDDPSEYEELNKWLAGVPYEKVVVIAGNHDMCIEREQAKIEQTDKVCYLENSGTEFKGMKIWGSPNTQIFYGVAPNYKAFMRMEVHLREMWELIPDDTDILLSHGPGYGLHDVVYRTDENMGSVSLGKWLARHKDALKLFACGHIHEGYGMVKAGGGPAFVNCSLMNMDYEPVNKPVRIILD